MRHMQRLLIIVLVLAVFTLGPVFVQAQDGEQQVTHTVQAGENLFRIALKYNTTIEAIAQANNITNPNLIRIGQVLIIPVAPPTPSPTPTATHTPMPVPTGTVTITPTEEVTATPSPTTAPSTTPPPSGTVHIVQAGDNLFRIALKYNLATSVVAAYNGIPNPNLIYVGQTIRIPPYAVAVATQPSQTPASPVASETTAAPVVTPGTPAPVTPPPSESETVGFAYGVQLYLPGQDSAQVMVSATDLGATWVKHLIDWSLYEPTAGNINWAPIDELVNAMDGAGVNILLTVTSAPGWARGSVVDEGPPADYQTYANFVGELAERYKGRVDAYEIWDEPNLQVKWNTALGLSAENYVALLRVAYAAIKTADPAAIVVTGGLAPTGRNDGVIAIDDRVFLRQMYAAGVTDWADAIGAHPLGWANPPDSTCCRNNRPAVPGWDDHPSFFFKQTLDDYRQIMKQNGDSSTYIWATKFGWGSNDGLNVTPSDALGFVTYTSLDEQSQYLIRGYQLGRELGYVGPMFLWNLNYCEVAGVGGEECLWSLLDPVGNPRPAYLAVQGMSK